MIESDPDFRQRMHFMGPTGFKPCTRPWPHDGPCAHPTVGQPDIPGKPDKWICLDWYDGPLTEIARVDFGDNDPMVQVCTFGWLDERDYDKIHVRLNREDLQKMIDLLDGKPIKNWRDEDETG